MSDGLRDPRTWRSPGIRVGEPGWPRDAPSDADEDILREAREHFRRCFDWEAGFRQSFISDVRFCNGDADNHWQWPEGLFQSRDGQDRPALTVNKTRQHCLQIVNDARQNKPQVRITPVSDEATKAAADVFEGVVRHIEYVSNAQNAYDTASEHQVQGGIGWWRVITDYESPDSFDQAIFIRRVKDPLSIYMDPDIQEADGSDARFAFVVDDLSREAFEAKYPEFADRIPNAGWAEIDGGWLDEDHVRVAEYYRRVEEDDTLLLLPDGSTLRESELDPAAREMARSASVRERRVQRQRIEWFKIAGGVIVDRQEWPGKYIPLVRVIGEEQVIEGRLDRKGHVRALKDPQRIYNYWTSSAVEAVALQSKTPYIADIASIEGFQDTWDSANTVNHAVLPFRSMDDAGRQLPPPQRQDPPQMPQAYLQGIQITQNEMMMVSGQYQPTMGQPAPNEVSGRAIQLRQRQGDNATYHFIDHLSLAIRFTGRILIDLIPKVYDTPRVLRILQLDGSIDRVQLDPNAPQALTQLQTPTINQQGQPNPTPQQLAAQSVVRIFNPSVGQYEVTADVGPAYQTRREEAFNAFLQVVNTAPMLMNIVGDLLFKAADFPMAEELAERLQRMVPPQALGLGPSPELQQAQQQIQALQAHIALLGEKLAVEQMKLRGRDEQKDIDAYEAVTKRMGALFNAQKTDSPYLSQEQILAMIAQAVNDTLQQSGMAPVSNAALTDALAASNAMNPGTPIGTGGQPGQPGQPGAPPGAGMLPPMVTNGTAAALAPVRAPLPGALAMGRRGP